ncbi:MAG: helix-turn-helix transcriptional regulator [Rhizobiaceae bacterium]
MHESTTEEKIVSVAKLKTADGLRRARRQRGLSQVELADLLRLSQSNISRWENGYEPIPHRVSLLLAELLSGERGRLHPYLRHLAETDWRISIFQLEKSGFFVDSRWLHLGENMTRYFDIPYEQSHMSLSSQFFDPSWRTSIYGSAPDEHLVAIEFERDCIRIDDEKKSRSCRLRSRQFVVDCEGYSKVTLSVSSIVGAANGQPPRIFHQCNVGDVKQAPPVRRTSKAKPWKPNQRVSVPMLNLAGQFLSAAKA